MEINLELKNKIIENDILRWVEIYKITNITNQKLYIGQAVSHIRKINLFLMEQMVDLINMFKRH